MKRNLLIGATFVVALIGLGVTERALEQTAQAQHESNGQVPIFEVDPFWPKTMPNNWVFGMTIGLGIDEKDQVWIIHRGNDPGNLDRTEFAFSTAGGGRGAWRRCRGGGAGGTRPTRVSECCDPAPPVVAFDQAGNVVHSWGGPSCIPTGRSRITASSSITRASSGLAATAGPIRTS